MTAQHPAASTLVPKPALSVVCTTCKNVKHCSHKGPEVKSCLLKGKLVSFGN